MISLFNIIFKKMFNKGYYFSIFLYYTNTFKVMEDKHFYKKTIVVAFFILASAIMIYIGYNEVMAQSSSGNQSAASNAAGPLTPYSPGPHSNPSINTPFNQSKLFPNSTETIKSFDKLNGNNSQFFTKDKSISNPKNTIGNSLSRNSYQNH
jgi:hypothetical protein